MANELQENEYWYGGLSRCCSSPIKAVGKRISVLFCSKCDNMCDEELDDDDEEDFWEDVDDD